MCGDLSGDFMCGDFSRGSSLGSSEAGVVQVDELKLFGLSKLAHEYRYRYSTSTYAGSDEDGRRMSLNSSYIETFLTISARNTLKHIFQKNAIEFEQRATRHE